jgi:arylsulfatase A-like enzyme
VIGLYYDFTSFIDKQIGRILDRLESLGLSENTMIIFASDHGDMKGAHGGMIDKGYLYEEVMHIPMMVHHPGKQGGLIEDFVYNMDIMPTVLDTADIAYGDLHGRSLLPLFDNEVWDRDCAYLEFHGIRFLYTQRSVIDRNNYKYIWTPGDFDELYDLNTDPGELNNVIKDPEYAGIKRSMQEKLKKCGVEFNDPVQDYIYKILGEWASPSGQIDITRQK